MMKTVGLQNIKIQEFLMNRNFKITAFLWNRRFFVKAYISLLPLLGNLLKKTLTDLNLLTCIVYHLKFLDPAETHFALCSAHIRALQLQKKRPYWLYSAQETVSWVPGSLKVKQLTYNALMCI